MKTISLNSSIAPFVFLALGAALSELTRGIGSWLFGVIGIILFLMGALTALHNYSSKLKYVVSIVCLFGVLISGAELLRPHDRTKTVNPSNSIAETISQDAGDLGGRYVNGYEIWEDDGNEAPIERECHHCKGSGDCPNCDGKGRVAIEKHGIDLGGGGSTYNEYQLCPLCNGDTECVYCRGNGTITY